MATAKLTIKRGTSMSSKDITLAAGSAESQSDTMSLILLWILPRAAAA